MPPIPTKIGRYDIIELVGRGGMGVLYRARDANLERDVALKMMLVDFSVDSAARGRFEREARAVARLQHRNIVTIHELGEADGTPYIVMEFLSGKDLDGLMNPDGSLTLVQKLDIAVQLCEGLGYAHEQGIVHRDVKPGNVRVLEDGTVKILDFGIAKFAVSSVTQTGSIMGTPSYMSPEQIMGQPVDGRADLFSAGVLLYELLGGKKPFVGEAPTAVVYQIMHVEPPPLTEMVPDLPDALLAVVSRALAKNPNERYSRASEMAADLQMVKMMLDLPLNTNSSSGDTGKLFATTIREKTATGTQTPMLNARMRSSAVAATADAAPRARFGDGGSNKTIIGAVAAVVVLLVGGAAYMMSGNRSEPPPAAASAGGGATPGRGAGSAGTGSGGAAAPAAAGAGAVAVSSTPAGAHILVNGVDTGKVTNAAIPAKAEDTIQLTLTGFEPSSAKLTASDIENGSINFRFSRTQGPVRLSASAPYPFELVQGNRVISAAAAQHEVTIQPGSGNVVARNKELLLSSPISVDFTKSRQDATLPALGLLNVFSNDGTCTATVDGQDLGPVPIVRKAVAPGSHTVAVKCAGGNPDSKRATVSAGAPVTVTF